MSEPIPDLTELRRKAGACPTPDNDPGTLNEWYELEDLTERHHPIPSIDAAFIVAANPAVVLRLLDDADALRNRLAHMTEARDNARAEVEWLAGRVEAVRTAMQDDDCLDPWVGNYVRVTDIRRALDGRADS